MYSAMKDRDIKKIVVHHSGSRVLKGMDNPALVEFRHKLRGFDEIGYHYIIGNGKLTNDGEVYVGRDVEKVGAHAYGHNYDSIGIALIGNFNFEHPTEKQRENLIKLIRDKSKRYNILLEEVYGHRELDNTETECPGRNFDMDKLREELIIGRRKLEKEFRENYRISRIVNEDAFSL